MNTATEKIVADAERRGIIVEPYMKEFLLLAEKTVLEDPRLAFERTMLKEGDYVMNCFYWESTSDAMEIPSNFSFFGVLARYFMGYTEPNELLELKKYMQQLNKPAITEVI